MDTTSTLAPALRSMVDLAPGRPYPERHESEPSRADNVAAKFWFGALQPFVRASAVERRRALAMVKRVEHFAPACADLSDPALKSAALKLRPALRRHGFRSAETAELFALVREAGARVTGMRHYPTQLMGGWWLLHGKLVEMATGEGKSYAATLPATCAALVGMPVHIITVNEYLAERDAETFAPLYEFFGLRAAAITHGLAPAARREAYAGHIVYVSNSELAFDYLRDRAGLGDTASPLHLAVQSLHGRTQQSAPVVLRGLVYGIVDEADSVFIDEARTPLILSQTRDGESLQPVAAALELAHRLIPDTHYLIEAAYRRVRLTVAGLDEIEAHIDADSDEPPSFNALRDAQEWVERALCALHIYVRDQHYVIVDGKVQIVDESTGRAMPDRSWEGGLHQLVEAKEGLVQTDLRTTMARISYQRFFRRYLTLSGMSGTVLEVATEIGTTYGLPVVRAPLHRPSQRRSCGSRCYLDADAKWAAVAAAVEHEAVANGRPVLVGTRTVEASENLAAMLDKRGVDHVVLNARQDRAEQEIVAQAGAPGRVTVATNMAGRGTDIVLGAEVAARGGLHVILTEYHESRRIDRQLFGRSARQGDPGSGEAIVALDDELFITQLPRLTAWLSRNWPAPTIPRALLALLRWFAQRGAEARNRDQREAALKQDRRYAKMLSFAGRGE